VAEVARHGTARGGGVDDGRDADQVVGGERAQAEDDGGEGQQDEGDGDGGAGRRMMRGEGGPIEAREEMLERAPAEDGDERRELDEVAGGLEALGGHDADEPAEGGAAEQGDERAESEGGAEVQQRIGPGGARQSQSDAGGDEIQGRNEVDQDAAQVGQLGGGISGAVDGLVGEDQSFDGIDQGVGSFGDQQQEQQQRGKDEEGPQILAQWQRGGEEEEAEHGGDGGKDQGRGAQAGPVAAEIAHQLLVIGELIEEVHEQPEAAGIDAATAEQAGDDGAAQKAAQPGLQGVHGRSASTMRAMPPWSMAAQVRRRNAPSREVSPVCSMSARAGPSATRRPS
jgi:hypothetical protein